MPAYGQGRGSGIITSLLKTCCFLFDNQALITISRMLTRNIAALREITVTYQEIVWSNNKSFVPQVVMFETCQLIN
ncbi:MAG: hypothetical protein BWY80_00520 [Firmicutes bacterium ADurb.Bin456]|nr:MAG: hypothetical protein BWY80_00520 [Firmicutes bacterium ADurb.Bin456]